MTSTSATPIDQPVTQDLSQDAPLHVLTIHHDYGIDTSIHRTYDGARNALFQFVVSWWSEEMDEDLIPADRDEAISQYFEAIDNEAYTLTQGFISD